MRNTLLMSTLALAFAVAGTAFAQSTTGATNPPSPNAAQQPNASQQSVLTVEKLKQDLQKAGFSEVKVLQDAFLIQAKTKDGNPILMTLGPNGVSALEASSASGTTTGQAQSGNNPSNSNPAPAPAKH
jgi:hypothetical protein